MWWDGLFLERRESLLFLVIVGEAIVRLIDFGQTVYACDGADSVVDHAVGDAALVQHLCHDVVFLFEERQEEVLGARHVAFEHPCLQHANAQHAFGAFGYGNVTRRSVVDGVTYFEFDILLDLG